MPDQLRDLLADLGDSARPHIRPPGVEAVRRSVRRRRSVRATATATGALAAVLALIMVVVGFGAPRPVPPIQPTLSPTSQATSSAAPTATSTPSAAPESSSLSPAGPAETGGSGQAQTGGQVPPCPPGVASFDRVASPNQPTMTYTYATVGGTACRPSNPPIRVFWATYTLDPDGVARLYGSGEDQVSVGAPVTLTVVFPPCPLVVYSGTGGAQIVASFAAPAPDPVAETVGAPFPYLTGVRDVMTVC